MTTIHRLRMIAIALLLALPPAAMAQQADDAPLPAWEQLTPAQRDTLTAPLRERWDASPEDRRFMLERAQRWRELPAGQRHRAQRGMHRWERMAPARRMQMQVLFERTRGMGPAQRRETYALFRHMLQLTPAEREALRRRWAGLSAAEREAWLREHGPHRSGPRGR